MSLPADRSPESVLEAAQQLGPSAYDAVRRAMAETGWAVLSAVRAPAFTRAGSRTRARSSRPESEAFREGARIRNEARIRERDAKAAYAYKVALEVLARQPEQEFTTKSLASAVRDLTWDPEIWPMPADVDTIRDYLNLALDQGLSGLGRVRDLRRALR